ncbi:MAG: hypothetical protein HY740_03065 [Chloroflexi bacterium]|nr:hypothetical protein [Chloroflexota bacterium]
MPIFPNFEQIISIFSLVFTFLSLVISMVGWFITAHYQQQILERQIAAEREGQTTQIILTQRVEQLNTLKEWFQDGERIWSTRKNSNADDKEAITKLQDDLRKWELRSGNIKATATVIDNTYPFYNSVSGCLFFIIEWSIYRFVGTDTLPANASLVAMIDRFYSLITKPPVKENAVEADAKTQNALIQAISRIDAILTSSIPDKHKVAKPSDGLF